MSIDLLTFAFLKQISKLSEQRCWILQFFGAPCCNDSGGVRQRWLVIESDARKESDLKQPEKRLSKKYTQAQSQLRKLCQQEFACAEDSFNAAKLLESQLPFHQLACKY